MTTAPGSYDSALRGGGPLVVVAQVEVDLVDEAPRVALAGEVAEGLQLVGGDGGARGVGRRGHHHAARTVRPVRPYRRHVQLEPARGGGGDEGDLGAEALDDLPVAGVGGVADEHLVTGVDERGGGQHERCRGAGGDDDPARIDLDAVLLAVEPRDGLPQGRQSEGRRVRHRPPVHDLPHRRHDGRGSAEVRFPEAEFDDVVALGGQRGGLLGELHGVEGGDGPGPP